MGSCLGALRACLQHWRWARDSAADRSCGGIVGIRVRREHLVLLPDGPGRASCPICGPTPAAARAGAQALQAERALATAGVVGSGTRPTNTKVMSRGARPSTQNKYVGEHGLQDIKEACSGVFRLLMCSVRQSGYWVRARTSNLSFVAGVCRRTLYRIIAMTTGIVFCVLFSAGGSFFTSWLMCTRSVSWS